MDNNSTYVISHTQKPKILTLVPNDPSSRYKTRQLQIQVVGKSKMIKTVLVNILDVAKDMQVPPSYIGTFMGYLIGAQAKWDAKKPERQQAHISGEHDPKDLSIILLQFISEVVLCPVCGLPEILLSVEGGSKVFGKCRACGGNSELNITNEKFKRYIINHPPETNSKGGAFAGNKTGAKKTKDSKESKEAKEAKESKPKSSKKKKAAEDDDDDDNVVWFSDTSEEAARRRREEMVPKALEERQKQTEIEEIRKLLSDNNPDDLNNKIKKYKTDYKFTDKELYPLLYSALLPGTAAELTTEIKDNLDTLKKITTTSDLQVILLSTIDNLCGNTNTSLAAKVALALKELYDQEIVEEEAINKWYGEDGSSLTPLVKEKSQPFIKWLNEAEEESEEEDDEDDDDEEDD